jgi:hypothetical protein
MPPRPITPYRPALERLEAKQLLSAGTGSAATTQDQTSAITQVSVKTLSADSAVNSPAQNHAALARRDPISIAQGSNAPSGQVRPQARQPMTGYLVYRITNPNRFNNSLTPPFNHVLVQTQEPIPGEEYNVLFVVVRNGTAKTFDASDGFSVKLPQDPQSHPILTGSQQWSPGQRYVFYVLTKKYYPLPSQVHSGFTFDLGGARSVAVPGPSGIFLRLTYKPATFDKTLDWIVAFGPGVQGGKGARFGMPDTATYEFLSAKTRRIDFGGYF